MYLSNRHHISRGFDPSKTKISKVQTTQIQNGYKRSSTTLYIMRIFVSLFHGCNGYRRFIFSRHGKKCIFTHTHEYPDISMVFFLQIILSPTNGKTQFKKIMAPDIAFKNIHFFRILTLFVFRWIFLNPI